MIPLAQLVDNTADGGFAVDYSLKISAWGKGAAGLFGFSSTEVLGCPCYEVIAGRDDGGNVFCQPECQALCCTRMHGLPPNYNLYTHTKAGQAVWLNVSIVALPPTLGTRGHLVHLVRNIDRQKRLEEFMRHTLAAGADLLADPPAPAQLPAPEVPLSTRELEILRLLRTSTATGEIAHTLGISQATVRTHIQHILGKLGVHSKLEAVLYALRLQLLP